MKARLKIQFESPTAEDEARLRRFRKRSRAIA